MLALVVGVPLGVYTALKRNSMLSQLLLAGSLLGVSLPTFLIGILLILVFSVQLGWLPSYGRGETVSLGWWSSGLFTDGWKHLILPSITLSLFQMTLVLRLVRSEMLEVLRSDYIKFARARSSAAPSTSATRSRTRWCPSSPSPACSWAASSPSPSSRAVFQWPGMGLLFIQAVQFADVPVMAAYLCLIALVFVVINLIVDLLYFVVDPRLRAGMTRPGLTDARRTQTLVGQRPGLDLAPRPGRHRRHHPAGAADRFLWRRLGGAAQSRPDQVELLDALLPPAWQANGQPTPAGHRQPGRDLYSAILYGTRVSLLIGLAAVALSMVIGIVLGLVSGYAGGRIDAFIMRVADVQLSFPAILIALLIDGVARAAVPRELHEVIAFPVLVGAIALAGWQYARTVRGSTLVENREYVQAARVIGVASPVIMFRHVLPNVLGPVLVLATVHWPPPSSPSDAVVPGRGRAADVAAR